MSKQNQVDAILAQWNAHQEWAGAGYGVDENTLRQMAQLAAEVGLTGPRSWQMCGAIPGDVDSVADEAGLVWCYDPSTSGWCCRLPHGRLQALVGTVTEVPGDTIDTVMEVCDKCGHEGPQAINPDWHVSCLGCGLSWVQRSKQCGALNQDSGWSCRLVAGHEGNHWDQFTGRSWGGRADAEGTDHQLAGHPDAAPAMTEADSVTLPPDVVLGLVRVLERSGRSHARVAAAYKGGAAKGSQVLAVELEDIAERLRLLLPAEADQVEGDDTGE